MLTPDQALYYLLMMMVGGFIVGVAYSMLFHWGAWD